MGFGNAFLKNQWLWFHILAGGMLVKLFLKLGFTDQFSFLLVVAIALLWEIYEYVSSDLIAVYGSKKAFLLDALGDIIGAVAMAVIVVI
jgi:hypothetical protein